MKKLLYVAPHLSTGGLPQYLTKKIELLKDELEFLICSFNPEDLALKIISAIPREKELNIQLRDAYNNYILIALQETLDPKKFIKNTGTWRRKNGKKFISLIWLIRFLRSKN
jgi:hypothetical protein